MLAELSRLLWMGSGSGKLWRQSCLGMHLFRRASVASQHIVVIDWI